MLVALALASSLGMAPPPVVMLEKRRGPHFVAVVTINGIEAGEFLVDTGATDVVIPEAMARDCHIDGPFKLLVAQTANGAVLGMRGKASVSVGTLTFDDVDVTVSRGNTPPLLGMSFLSQVEMKVTSTSIELRSNRDMPAIEIAEIEPALVKMAPIGLPAQIGDARCDYDDGADLWRCDPHVHQERDGAVTTGATEGVKVGIELSRSPTCLTSVKMTLTSTTAAALVVPWSQSVILADGVARAAPRVAIGRAGAGGAVSYVLRLADRCVGGSGGGDFDKPHDVSWSVPLLVDGKPARVRWMHRWTPATATEQELLESMTPPDPPPPPPHARYRSRSEREGAAGTFPLWTITGGATSLVLAGAGAGVAAAFAPSSKLETGALAGALALAVSAPILVGGGWFLDQPSIDPAGRDDDEAPAAAPDARTAAARGQQARRYAAYQRQLAPL